MLQEDPKVEATREGIHMRIQVEIYHKAKDVEAIAEEQLEAPPGWKEVPDLMLETGEDVGITDATIKRKRNEVAQGWRKRQKEDEIRVEKEIIPLQCRG